MALLLSPGARVNWSHMPCGGCAVAQSVAGILRKIGPKRFQIEVRVCESYGEQRWLPDLKWVPKDAVRPRVLPCAAFSEPMVLHVQGFTVKAWKHPTRVSSQFPAGVWYGEIDGYPLGSPRSSEESALHEAYEMLCDGRYRTTLLSAIEHYERWLRDQTEEKFRAKATATLPKLRERLSKVEKILMGPPSEPREILILRGNPDRGADTGPGYGRLVPALFLREFDQTGHNVKCRLLADDTAAVGSPNNAGEEGWWCVSQVVWGASAD